MKDLTKASHGIKEASSNTLRQRTTLTSQDLQIQRAYSGYLPILNEFANTLGWSRFSADSHYKVCDLLAQVPAVHRPYSHTRSRVEKLYVLDEAQFRYSHSTRMAWAVLWVRKSEFGDGKALKTLRSRSYFSEWFEQVEAGSDHDNATSFETKPHGYGRSSLEALSEVGKRCIKAGVLTILTPNGYRYYLSNFEPRVRVHQLLAAFMVMFYFGSVARYRPATYEKMLQSKYGWVIEEFLATQGPQFVYLVANALLGREVICPWALRASETRL